MREQAKKLFYINKQLNSNNTPQILQGLYKTRAFILQTKIPQYINSLIMSLLDLFNTTKLSYIRMMISQILPMSFGIIGYLPSKPEFISIMTEWLKSNDATVRILTMEIISKLYNLFIKDSSIYHFLLGKLSKRGENFNNIKRGEVSVKEFVGIVGCLRALLQNSEFLAGIFSNNLRELNQIGGVDLKIICYLCVYAKFQERCYQKILRSMHELCQPHLLPTSTSTSKSNKKFYKKYLIRLITKSCKQNYLCINYYSNSNLHSIFTNLKQKINKIQYQYYNFLIPSSESSSPQNMTETKYIKLYSCEELLDLCYEHFRMYGRITGEIQEQVRGKIQEDLGKGVVRFQTVLCSFYCMAQTRALYQFDDNFTQYYNLQDPKNTCKKHTKMLKIALTTCNFKLAKKIISHLSNQDQYLMERSMSALVLFQAYVDLHLQPTQQNFMAFFVVVSNLAISGQHFLLLTLVEKWRKRYQNQLLPNRQPQQPNIQSTLQQSLHEYKLPQVPLLTNKMLDQQEQKTLIKCQEQFEIMKQNSKISMYFWDIENQPFYYVYFGKCTILDIFRCL